MTNKTTTKSQRFSLHIPPQREAEIRYIVAYCMPPDGGLPFCFVIILPKASCAACEREGCQDGTVQQP